MRDLRTEIGQSLSKLISLPLSIARDAADMKNFQFGAIRPHPSGKGTVGSFALHIQCPWRLTQDEHIVTGADDYWEPAEADGEVDLEDWRGGNLQRKRLSEILSGASELVVRSVVADDFGGFELFLSGGFRLQVFPGGSRGEYWRFFQPGSLESHLVIDAARAVARDATQ
jgi:hypothetical protein